MFAEPGELSDALHALSASGPELSEGEVLLADVYAWRSDDREATTDDELSTRLKEHLAAADLPAALNRVTFVVAAPDLEGTDIVTFRAMAPRRAGRGPRRARSASADRRAARPVAADQLRARTPAGQPGRPRLRATARDKRDERLVAVAEVRDMTPVRDERGRIVALPALERTARQAFEAMRTFQSRRRSRERLQVENGVMLYAWPAADFEADEARAVISRMGRMSAGLGQLEMVMLRVRLGTGDGAGSRARRLGIGHAHVDGLDRIHRPEAGHERGVQSSVRDVPRIVVRGDDGAHPLERAAIANRAVANAHRPGFEIEVVRRHGARPATNTSRRLASMTG